MKRLLSLLFLQFVVCSGFSSVDYLCGSQITKLDDRLGNTPSSYKFSTIVTDWIAQTTSYVDQVKNETLVNTYVSDRNGLEVKYIQTAADRVIVANLTKSECEVLQTYNAFPSLSNVTRSIIGFNGSTISAFLKNVVDYSVNNMGSLVEVHNSSLVETGVEAVQWVSCMNTSSGNLQVEVVYADKSFQPPSASYSNPIILYVRVTEFDKNKTATASTSIEILKREKVGLNDIWYSQVPDALFCANMTNTSLPLSFSEETSYDMKYSTDSQTLNLTFSYSKSGNVVFVAQDAFNSDVEIPVFGYKPSFPGASEIIHDFYYGYEYALSEKRCIWAKAIPEASRDVNKTDVFSIKEIQNIFLNDGLTWAFYQNDAIDNVFFSVWKAVDGLNVLVVRGSSGSIYDIRIFNKSSRKLQTTYKFSSLPKIIFSKSLVADCFSDFEGIPFTFNITGKSLQDVVEIGRDSVTWELAKSLSSVALINPYRVAVLYNILDDGVLQAVVRLSEKTATSPSTTRSFNYSAEVSSINFVNTFNSTLQKGDFKFTVYEKEWLVRSGPLGRFPTVNANTNPIFYGYSGGSMFVLGLFSLLLGCGIGAGGVFFVSRRQRITSLAYQVFE